MKELEAVYKYLAKLEEGYSLIIQENDAYSVEGDMLLMAARDKLYCGLTQLEELIDIKGLNKKMLPGE
jgi:hypothetical protein